MSRTSNIHSRRSGAGSSIQRRGASRSPYEKVLIVCEGSKTEPLYFEGIKDFYEIDTANIVITGDCGSDPISVVNHAIELYRQSVRRGGIPFDRVYCVIDRDKHPKFADAVAKLKSQRPNDVFFGVVSIPSFELWILLHFKYTTSPFEAAGGKSCGDKVFEELRKVWCDYEKGMRGVFLKLFDKVDDAKRNAERLLEYCSSNGCVNPSTQVHTLVDYLQKIK